MARDVHLPPGRTSALSRPGWFLTVTALLSLTGLAISIYMTLAHYNRAIALICTESSTIDCASVTSSEYSELFGIPLPLLGLSFFVGIGALTVPAAWRSESPVVRWARLGGVIIGVLFVVYLVSAELLVLGKICLWCTAVHVITVALFGLVVLDEYRRAGQTS
ncbi:vitamin K epoxide reductase family protein [Streptosporangium sp. NPDC051022]|uniref:vitamin K epoxide reductase family protein n=1 Tax=Streptosporangium sp. NPDC051022 TaxID=3155752 RepID=UPI0034337B20